MAKIARKIALILGVGGAALLTPEANGKKVDEINMDARIKVGKITSFQNKRDLDVSQSGVWTLPERPEGIYAPEILLPEGVMESIRKLSYIYEQDAELIVRLIMIESQGNASASSINGKWLMQLTSVVFDNMIDHRAIHQVYFSDIPVSVVDKIYTSEAREAIYVIQNPDSKKMEYEKAIRTLSKNVLDPSVNLIMGFVHLNIKQRAVAARHASGEKTVNFVKNKLKETVFNDRDIKIVNLTRKEKGFSKIDRADIEEFLKNLSMYEARKFLAFVAYNGNSDPDEPGQFAKTSYRYALAIIIPDKFA